MFGGTWSHRPGQRKRTQRQRVDDTSVRSGAAVAHIGHRHRKYTRFSRSGLISSM